MKHRLITCLVILLMACSAGDMFGETQSHVALHSVKDFGAKGDEPTAAVQSFLSLIDER